MGERVSRSVSTSQDHAGVEVEYRKRDRTLLLSGWYDTMVGIAPERISLGMFLTQLGITTIDCSKALAEYENEHARIDALASPSAPEGVGGEGDA